MKQLFTIKTALLAIAMATALSSKAQCDVECTGTVVEYEVLLSNEHYTGDHCFIATHPTLVSHIATSVNWNGWNMLGFGGNQEIHQTINFKPKGKVVCYPLANLAFDQVNFAKDDTFYAYSNSTTILNYTTNNNSFNVIMLPTGGIVDIEGVIYFPGDTLHFADNPSNILAIVECEGTSLPITIKSFTAEYAGDKRVHVQWETIEPVALHYSRDGGITWGTVSDMPYTTKANVYPTAYGPINMYQLFNPSDNSRSKILTVHAPESTEKYVTHWIEIATGRVYTTKPDVHTLLIPVYNK